jgi:LDH2 family malate/lactate/ureidoglycolate dehydrogenase
MSDACRTEGAEPVTLLPREVRLVVERILLLTPLPSGMVPAVRDVLLYSAAAGLGGLPALRRDFAALRAARPGAIALHEAAPGEARLDANGQHSWVLLPVALDALAEMAAAHGSARLAIHGALVPEELAAACAMGGRLGLSITLVDASSAAGVTLVATPGGAEDPVLAHALRDGIPAEAALWWELHHLSNTSLSPDTPESRRHAGPVIVLEDGRVIGRSDHDDDTDMSLLTEKAS